MLLEIYVMVYRRVLIAGRPRMCVWRLCKRAGSSGRKFALTAGCLLSLPADQSQSPTYLSLPQSMIFTQPWSVFFVEKLSYPSSRLQLLTIILL